MLVTDIAVLSEYVQFGKAIRPVYIQSYFSKTLFYTFINFRNHTN